MGQVRIATEADATAIASIYAPYVRDTVFTFEEQAPSPEEMGARLRKIIVGHPFLVFQEDGAVLGYAYASPHKERAAYRWSVDVAVYVAASEHRRGIGRALYGSLLDILARQGFHTAYAGVTLPNENSIGLHEAMGFRHFATYPEVGFKFGEWRDVGWWTLPLSPNDRPSEPVAFSELSSLAAFAVP
jgi:phosphinothricin acetyltransferase